MVRHVVLLLAAFLAGCPSGSRCPVTPPADLELRGGDEGGRPSPDGGPALEGGPAELDEALPALVLNEVRSCGEDWVELRNLGAAPAAGLGGWALSDSPGDPAHTWALPPDFQIPAGERAVLLRSDNGSPGFPFGLKCGEETVYLLGPGGEVVDQVELPALADGLTWGRLPDGTGEWAANLPTPGAPNQGAGPGDDLGDLIFAPFEVVPIDLTLPPASVDSLWADSHTYVPATFEIASGRLATPPRPVGIRIKGAWGSFRDLNGKTAFKVRFIFQDGETWLGCEHITLNNMVQDPSMLHEVIAYGIFRALGIPCPRVGYAWVTVNGEPYGLYALVEPYDDVFLARVFPQGTGHLYENDYFVDLVPGNATAFDMDEGDKEDRTDLEQLIAAINETPDDQWLEVVSALADLPEMIRMWAVEQYIGHWDGYAPSVNNFFLHSTPEGFFTMLPWGTDQTFGDWRDCLSGAGVLFTRCLAIPACRRQYDEALMELLLTLEGRDDMGLVQELAAALAPWVEQDQRKPYSTEDVGGAVQGTLEFLEGRWGQVMEQVSCWLDSAADFDGDGHWCEQDCDESDPGTHVGADDLCGDGIDQDCNGWLDDGWDCPDCHAHWRGPHRYLLCTTPRPYAFVADHCAKEGSAPLLLNSVDEELWLHSRMEQMGLPGGWLPLTDIAEEGLFVWSDGSLPAYTGWGPGEPNNWGEEDCTEFFPWGGWNDVHCDAPHPVLCEDPCAPGEDGDDDGHLRCDDDCDDGAPDAYPGAPEICGDEIDQDCNGFVDDDPSCVAVEPVDPEPAIPGAAFLRVPEPLPRASARAVCQAQGTGADLAWFAGAEEQAVVSAALGQVAPDQDHWLGLNDQAVEGLHVWANGMSPAFSTWAPGQPNDGDGNGQDCVRLLTSGLWNDTDCAEPYPALCRLKSQ